MFNKQQSKARSMMDAMKADLAELDNLQQGASQSQTVAVKPGPSSTALNSLVNEFDLSPFGGSPRTPPPERKMYSSKSEPALPTKTDAKGRRFRPGAGVVLNSLGSSDRDKDKGSRSNKRSSPPSQDRDSPQEKQGDRDRERDRTRDSRHRRYNRHNKHSRRHSADGRYSSSSSGSSNTRSRTSSRTSSSSTAAGAYRILPMLLGTVWTTRKVQAKRTETAHTHTVAFRLMRRRLGRLS
mmetsp:Transcript_7614/g.14415  ORF Transcript_7614/g.14415 Transcript_7614/m.14415 type:complete len:239 (-) Transcript_7614:381-1097(-)